MKENNVEEMPRELTQEMPQRRSTLRTLPENRPSRKKLMDTLKCLKSPLFTVQVVLFALGNCSVGLSLNVVNDLVSRETDGKP